MIPLAKGGFTRQGARMRRLNVNRYLLGWTIVLLWLVPATLEMILHDSWISGGDDWSDFALILRDMLVVPDTVFANINAVSLIAPILLVLVCEPAPPVRTTLKAILPEQRFRAGVVDYAVAQMVIALPLQLLLMALNAYQTGHALDPAWLGQPRQFLEPLGPVAWLLYTGWHIARRKQTLGQYVNRYRLVHPGPPHSPREVIYQIIRIIFFAVTSTAARRFSRHHRAILTHTKAEYAALDETETPGWYAGAGVTTEVLDYQPKD